MYVLTFEKVENIKNCKKYTVLWRLEIMLKKLLSYTKESHGIILSKVFIRRVYKTEHGYTHIIYVDDKYSQLECFISFDLHNIQRLRNVRDSFGPPQQLPDTKAATEKKKKKQNK